MTRPKGTFALYGGEEVGYSPSHLQTSFPPP